MKSLFLFCKVDAQIGRQIHSAKDSLASKMSTSSMSEYIFQANCHQRTHRLQGVPTLAATAKSKSEMGDRSGVFP